MPGTLMMALLALSAAQQAEIKRYFDAELIDGASARWAWPAQREKKIMYCGWFNAKNRLGAYTGWTQYYVSFDKAGHIDGATAANDAGGQIVVEAVCGENGYDMTGPPRR